MTSSQEARLLRAQAKALEEEADQLADDDTRDPVGFLAKALDGHADACLAVATELDSLDALAVNIAAIRAYDAAEPGRPDLADWTEVTCRFTGNGAQGCFASPLNRHGGPCVPCWTRALQRIRELKEKKP